MVGVVGEVAGYQGVTEGGARATSEEGTVATLGEWRHRPGGKWIVERMTCFGWRSRWMWDVRGADGAFECGYTWCYWLARRRAIAALAKMRGDDS